MRHWPSVFVAAVFLVALAGCGGSRKAAEAPPPHDHARAGSRPVVVLLSDFGTRDDAIGILRGVVLSIARDATIVDLTHDVPRFDVAEGARLLADAPGVFPEGTVFVCVVDPGTGNERRAIAIRLKNGRFLVGPDNGLLGLAADKWGVEEAREIKNPRFLRTGTPQTSHGRDVFAPAGAMIALGQPPFSDIGPPLSAITSLDLPVPSVAGDMVKGIVVTIDDPFGNVWTNITPHWLAAIGAKKGDRLSFAFRSRTVEAPWVDSFGDVGQGSVLAYLSNRGAIALGINRGDASNTYGLKRGDSIAVSKARSR
jgi:S-adenosylmethionine hydrolase